MPHLPLSDGFQEWNLAVRRRATSVYHGLRWTETARLADQQFSM
jgi:hypothetical protein